MNGLHDIKAGARIWVCLAAALLLSACAADWELPDHDQDGTLKPSPCACVEIEDFDGRGFRWDVS